MDCEYYKEDYEGDNNVTRRREIRMEVVDRNSLCWKRKWRRRVQLLLIRTLFMGIVAL